MWFKVDDTFHSHRKVLAASPAALGLWVVAGSWCGANPSDGFVPDHVLQRLLPDAQTLAKELVACGLWKRSKGGFRFHDWTDYQPSKDEALAGKAKKSAGGVLGNHRRWHVDGGRFDPQCRYCRPTDPGNDHANSRTPKGYKNASVQPWGQRVDNQPAGSPQADDQQKPDRSTDRYSDRTPIGTPNPPDPTRPDPIGGRSTTVTHDRPHASPEPPSTCEDHHGNPSPPPCGRCADARRAHVQWQTEQRRRLDAAPRCRTHRGQPAHNCAPCRSEQLAQEPA